MGNDGNTSTSEMWAWIGTPAGGKQLLETLITHANGFVSVAANVRDINDGRRLIAKARRNDPADGYSYGVVLVPVDPGAPQDGARPRLTMAEEDETGDPGPGKE